jgi:hypothetical protein
MIWSIAVSSGASACSLPAAAEAGLAARNTGARTKKVRLLLAKLRNPGKCKRRVPLMKMHGKHCQQRADKPYVASRTERRVARIGGVSENGG